MCTSQHLNGGLCPRNSYDSEQKMCKCPLQRGISLGGLCDKKYTQGGNRAAELLSEVSWSNPSSSCTVHCWFLLWSCLYLYAATRWVQRGGGAAARCACLLASHCSLWSYPEVDLDYGGLQIWAWWEQSWAWIYGSILKCFREIFSRTIITVNFTAIWCDEEDESLTEVTIQCSAKNLQLCSRTFICYTWFLQCMFYRFYKKDIMVLVFQSWHCVWK